MQELDQRPNDQLSKTFFYFVLKYVIMFSYGKLHITQTMCLGSENSSSIAGLDLEQLLPTEVYFPISMNDACY